MPIYPPSWVANRAACAPCSSCRTIRGINIELPHAYGLAKDSVILLEQIRTIDKKRLMSRIGELPPATMSRVNKAILISLGFAEQTS